MFLLTLFSRLLAEHSKTPVSSLDNLVMCKSTVTLVMFLSLVDNDMLVLDTLSFNDLLNLLHCTSGEGWPTPIHLSVIFSPSLTYSFVPGGSRISAASVYTLMCI